jgi:microcystin-dependent protein
VGLGNGVASTSTISSGLLKQNRDTFVGDLGVPIGAIMPYAGNRAPYGYILCDGAEVEIDKFPDLWDVIGRTYSATLVLAGSFVRGQTYTIVTVGTTDFRLVGASANTVGLSFNATAAGSGTGTASTTSFIGINTFRVPDLRGRFPLGADNMDNTFTVPTDTGGIADAGGGNIDRVPDIRADIVGQGSGQSAVSLTLANIPEHSHNIQNGNNQYSAVLVDTAIDPPATSGLGPTAPGQAQYLRDTGGVKKPAPDFQLGQALGVMNPYLTLNYIIRSGPPTFITT